MLTPATGRPAVTHVETRLGTIRDGGNNIQATITRDSTKPALASATRVAHDKRSSPLQRERERERDGSAEAKLGARRFHWASIDQRPIRRLRLAIGCVRMAPSMRLDCARNCRHLDSIIGRVNG